MLCMEVVLFCLYWPNYGHDKVDKTVIFCYDDQFRNDAFRVRTGNDIAVFAPLHRKDRTVHKLISSLVSLLILTCSMGCGDQVEEITIRRHYGEKPPVTEPTVDDDTFDPTAPTAPPPAPPHGKQITLFIEDHPSLTEDLIVSACESWAERDGFKSGFGSCVRTDDEDGADARVYAESSSCYDGEDDDILGYAFERDFHIKLYVDCLERYGERDYGNEGFSRQLFTTAIHEFGHLFGIWKHVPKADGVAIMNAYSNDLIDLVDLDRDAFMKRSVDHSILPGDGEAFRPAGEGHSCAFKH